LGVEVIVAIIMSCIDEITKYIAPNVSLAFPVFWLL
jgi:hypothetical protein